MLKLLGVITQEEKNAIMVLFERKLGIEELAATLDSDLLYKEEKDAIQNKMSSDLEKTKLALDAWWNTMYEKYQWESLEGHTWSIDFETCEIFLTKENLI